MDSFRGAVLVYSEGREETWDGEGEPPETRGAKSEEGPGPGEEAEEEGEGFMGSMFGRLGKLVSQFYVLCEYSCTQFSFVLKPHSLGGFT